MRHAASRLLAVLLLLSWTLPGLGALGVGLHLAIDHHHAPDPSHSRHIAELMDAIDHGHRHDGDAVPDHRHDARFGSVPAVGTSLKTIAVLPSVASVDRIEARVDRSTGTTRDGPPTTLFAAHCCLLL